MDNLAIGVFVLLPVYAALLKLFYLGQHRYYVEHLVFATHLQTFTFLVFTLTLPISALEALPRFGAIAPFGNNALMLWIAVYHYLALRRYYAQGRIRTGIKFACLMTAYTALLLPTAMVVVFAATVLSL